MDFFVMAFLVGQTVSNNDIPTNWIIPLLQIGVTGVLLLLFIIGRVFGRDVVEQERKRADEARTERDEEREYSRGLDTKMREEVVPVLTQVNISASEMLKATLEWRTEFLKVMTELRAELAAAQADRAAVQRERENRPGRADS